MVVATDPDMSMLALARGRARDARASVLLVAADAEALPFRSGAFDEAVVGLALCTIARPARALAEIGRALRRDGLLRMLDHVRVEHAVLGRLQDWLTPVWRRVGGGCRLDRRTVVSVVDAGFLLERVGSHVGGLFVSITARVPPEPGVTRAGERRVRAPGRAAAPVRDSSPATRGPGRQAHRRGGGTRSHTGGSAARRPPGAGGPGRM